MKWLILLGFIYSGHCSDGQAAYKNEERRIAGGGNFGGFIGLTTYVAGPFLVKGKYERDNYGGFSPNWQGYGPRYDLKQDQSYDAGSKKYDEDNDGRRRDSVKDDKDTNDESKKQDRSYGARYISNVDYKDIQRDGQVTKINEKYDDYLEYLGYRGGKDYCVGENGDRDGYGNRNGYGRYSERDRGKSNYSSYYDDETRDRCDYLFGYTGPTANDEPENIIRPCALNDWQCIRKYFAANGKCKPAYGPIPDPLYLDTNTVFYPAVNLTVSAPNLMVRGLSNAKIIEFYVNKKTGNLVFAIDVANLNETVPRAYFRYRRTAKESIVLADYTTVLYRGVTFTAVIPSDPYLRLDLADIHPDVQDTTPPFFIGPGAINSKDPDVVTAFAEFNLLLPFIIREILTYQAPLFTSIYIQENICDFGLKVVSV